MLRDALAAADAAGDWRLASFIAGDLGGVLLSAGRLAEALAAIGQKAGYTQRAGLGPWSQLADHARRLQILKELGEHEQVLTETGTLRDHMERLPDRPGAADWGTNPWNVRELILDTARSSAQARGRRRQGLDLNAEIIASKRQRGAGIHELTRTQFNDAGPLIRLGRLEDADRLLRQCQQVFEEHRDAIMLAGVLGVRAMLEYASGRAGSANLERTALRLRYACRDPRAVEVSHHNLAVYLSKTGEDRAGQRAHQLAAALISKLTGTAHDLADPQRALADEVRNDDGADLLLTLGDVIRIAEQTDGVRLGELIVTLQPDPQAVEQALAEILRAAADSSAG
jgi:hypothetical protein